MRQRKRCEAGVVLGHKAEVEWESLKHQWDQVVVVDEIA